MNYIITGKNFTSPLIEQYRGVYNYQVLDEAELKNSKISFSDQDKIYCPEETSVPFLEAGMSKNRWEQLQLIKNKFQCRILLKNIYPDFYFKAVSIKNLEFEKLTPAKKYIIKPQKGFFGVGVREIDSESDLKKIATDIKNEIVKNVKIFSEDVFTSDDFIIEEYARGNEYSFDLFYNEAGEVVLNSFCHHPLPIHEEYFHLLYYTGSEIYNKFHEQVMNIFTEFNKTLNLKNVPIHAEFKEYNGKLIPIEFNVPRFGGFGLVDLPFYAFGQNPYTNFFESKSANWKKIFENNNKNYGWILCYNGFGVDLNTYEPDYEKLTGDLGNILQFHKLDYTKNPVFALAFVELEDQKHIEKILSIDFKNYFRPKK